MLPSPSNLLSTLLPTHCVPLFLNALVAAPRSTFNCFSIYSGNCVLSQLPAIFCLKILPPLSLLYPYSVTSAALCPLVLQSTPPLELNINPISFKNALFPFNATNFATSASVGLRRPYRGNTTVLRKVDGSGPLYDENREPRASAEELAAWNVMGL